MQPERKSQLIPKPKPFNVALINGIALGLIGIFIGILHPSLRFLGEPATATVTSVRTTAQENGERYGSDNAFVVRYTFLSPNGQPIQQKIGSNILGHVPAEGDTFEIYYLKSLPLICTPHSNLLLMGSALLFGFGLLSLLFSIIVLPGD